MIKETLKESISVKKKILDNEELIAKIEKATKMIEAALRADKKILFCGNGGSAADAQHLAAELSGRFNYDRDPLYAEALHVNTSYLTAVANDYSYDDIYSRLIKGIGHSGDVLVCLSTSGNSQNIIRAINQARKMQMLTIGFTGQTGGNMSELVDLLINIPSKETPRIQEAHITVGHAICEVVESRIFPRS
ncbi:D-sedoheptulose-7-phosphate isomerase [Jiulongibacter sediminis]|uniref:Phosphoheptose isomerase n=1 Tax=Jiulongibacter sediminis TaxID=1605367 RepID=A0A0P7BRQ7_9BACT|nr:SIS domain-containing protein [Jiulongibacter sediminis]KPM47039.1 phosphoheptose isomerase [Jiulongibacter sediminis]TBX22382.1 phosphoheptose isomerase [Jiulongibacter sediminis]